jgi:hypothetical protein
MARMSDFGASPFAEQLKKAIAGQAIPKAPSVEKPAVVDSAVSGGEKHQTKPTHEARGVERHSDGSGSVSGQAVHKRVTTPGSRLEPTRESETGQAPDALLTDIQEKARILGALNAFIDAAGYTAEGDGELMSTVTERLKEAQALVPSQSAGADTMLVKPFSDEGFDRLRAIQLEFVMELNEVREALEGLAAEGEVVIPDNIEVLLKTSSAEVSSDAKGQDARSPKKGARGSTRSKTGNAFAGETRRAPGSQQESNQTEQVEDIEAQVAKLSELVEQWKTLRAGFQPDRFLKEMKKGWNKNALPMNKAGEWLESEMNPKKWDKEKRAFFVENVLRPMEEWVARAETVAKDLHEKSKKASMARRKRKTTAGKSKEAEQKSQPVAVQVLEAEPQAVAPDHRVADPSAAPPAARVEPVDVAAGVHSDSDEADPATTLPLVEDQPVGEAVESKPESNVRELRTGRPITALNDLTQWERMEVAKRNVYRHKLRTLKSEYMGEILRELQKNSLDAADMTESIAQSLRQYLSEAIRITIPDIELTASDTETLVAELMTEDSMIKPE